MVFIMVDSGPTNVAPIDDMLQAAAAASSLPPSDSSPLSCKGAVGGGGGGRRKPLQILTGIFSRKGNNTREMPDSSSEERDNFFLPDDGDVDMWDSGGEIMDDGGIIPEPREALHSPYHARTIDQDMQNLRLSRQDNPFLQVLASRECLNESDDGSEYEEKNLMSKENLSSHSRPGEPLSLEEVHARLVRSPPPVMWTRGGHNSEPSFTHLTTTTSSSLGADFVFQFPPAGGGGGGGGSGTTTGPSPTLSCRFLGPFRNKESTLDILTAKFNLSPQPRRRPPSLKTGGGPTFINHSHLNHHHHHSEMS